MGKSVRQYDTVSLKGIVVLCVTVLLVLQTASFHVASAQKVPEPPIRLPLNAPLPVNVVTVGLKPEFFGLDSMAKLQQILESNVRSKAASYAGFFLDDPILLATFDVELQVLEAPQRFVAEFVNDLSLITKDPARLPLELKQANQDYRDFVRSFYGGTIAGSLTYTVTDMEAVVQLMAYYTEKYVPAILEDYNVYLLCGTTFFGGKIPVYYTLGYTPERQVPNAIVGLNMYGGMWTGRHVVIDLCAVPNPFGNFAPKSEQDILNYLPLWVSNDPNFRLGMVVKYVDEVIDTFFVKSLLYLPRYQVTYLFDVVVIDLTTSGGGVSSLINHFSPELFESAMKQLAPYNYYTSRYSYYHISDVPQMRQTIRTVRGYQVIDVEAALDTAQRLGIIKQTVKGMAYTPILVFISDSNIFPDSPGTLGIAWPDSQDPRYPRGVVAGVVYQSIQREGLTFTIIHEAGHTLGLAHPFQDLDESQMTPGKSGNLRPSFANRWIYAYVDSSMTYASVLQVTDYRELFVYKYPMRTFFSIFDLDALDRATISMLLYYYLLYRTEALNVLEKLNRPLEAFEKGKKLLELADQSAVEAVKLFQQHKYFDRLEFEGLGSQLVSSFDYAWLAYLSAYTMYNLIVGVQDAAAFFEPQIEELQKKVSDLSGRLQSTMSQLDETKRQLDQVRNSLEEERRQRTAIQADLDKTRADLQRTQDALTSKEKELAEANARASTYMYGIVGVAAVAAVLVASTLLFGRRKSAVITVPKPS
jgi:ElaB/YqjD/DUF883 family membrane-anchored ribosome-binding protein